MLPHARASGACADGARAVLGGGSGQCAPPFVCGTGPGPEARPGQGGGGRGGGTPLGSSARTCPTAHALLRPGLLHCMPVSHRPLHCPNGFRCKHEARQQDELMAAAAADAAAAAPAAAPTPGGAVAAAAAAAADPGAAAAAAGRPAANGAAASSATIATGGRAAAAAAAPLASAASHAGASTSAASVPNGVPSPASPRGGPTGPPPDYSDARLLEVAASLDRRLGALWAGLPPNTLLLVATGAGDTAACERLYELRCKRQAASRPEGMPAWSQADEAAFADKAAREVKALAFFAVKQ